MIIKIEKGLNGLYYATTTDAEYRGLLVASNSRDEVLDNLSEAFRDLRDAKDAGAEGSQ